MIFFECVFFSKASIVVPFYNQAYVTTLGLPYISDNNTSNYTIIVLQHHVTRLIFHKVFKLSFSLSHCYQKELQYDYIWNFCCSLLAYKRYMVSSIQFHLVNCLSWYSLIKWSGGDGEIDCLPWAECGLCTMKGHLIKIITLII